MNLAFIICVLVVIGASFGFAYLRGLPKTRIRGIKHVACFGLALLATFLVKGSASLTATVSSTVENALEDASTSQLVQTILADGSVVGFVSALLAPLLFLLFFISLEILLGIAYIILIACLSKQLDKHECNTPLKGLRTALWALLSGLLILVVLLAPISAYSDYAAVASDAISAEESYAETALEVKASAVEVENTVVVKAHRTLFGWLDTALASFQVGGEKTNVKTELPVLAASVADLQTILENGEFTSPANASAIRRIADRMESAPLLSSLLSSVVYEVTDQYVKDPSNAADPLTYMAMLTLHNDSTDSAKLRADFYTLADVLIVYGSISGENNDAAALDTLLKTLENNPNMKPLLDEVKRIARELVEEEVSFAKTDDGNYSDTVVSTVDELNEIAKLSKEEQKERVVDCVKDLLDEADISQTDARIDYFADVVVNELLPEQGGTITPESAEDFLIDYITEHYAELRDQGLI